MYFIYIYEILGIVLLPPQKKILEKFNHTKKK